jgi:hypothetical protein
MNDLSDFLLQTLDRELPHLRALGEERASVAPKPGAWSPKQELGHLLDSAANNHIRFVRAALDGAYEGPGYAQDNWVKLHAWQLVPWSTLVEFWWHHNQLLAHLLAQISDEALKVKCIVSNNAPVTLRFLIEDYVLHMQHHLDHLLSREKITQYPGAQLGV